MNDILNFNKKERKFSELEDNEIISDKEELENLRLLTAYYKNDGKFNNKFYSEIDLKKLDKYIDHLREQCIDDAENLLLVISENATEDIKIHNRLIMCHNIINAYARSILKNSHFRLYVHPSKNDIKVSYKCNYKRSIFDSNEKIMSNVHNTRLIDRYKKFKCTESFKNAKFSNSIKMLTLENNVSYNSATLCSMKN